MVSRLFINHSRRRRSTTQLNVIQKFSRIASNVEKSVWEKMDSEVPRTKSKSKDGIEPRLKRFFRFSKNLEDKAMRKKHTKYIINSSNLAFGDLVLKTNDGKV